MSAPFSSPPPPPSAGSSPSLHINSKSSHRSWNSLMSDITMSEDEEGHLAQLHQQQLQQQQQQRDPHQQLHLYQQQQQYRNQQRQQTNIKNPPRSYGPMDPTEEIAQSVLEYSQSSDEGYSGQPRPHHQREDTALSSTSFRFREDITQSARIVRFASSSEDLSDASSTQRMQVNAEDTEHLFRKHSNSNSNSDDKHHHHQPSSSGSNHRRHRRYHHEHQRGGGATVNRETFLSTSNKWMTKLAYSFRTPPAPKDKKKPLKSSDKHTAHSSSSPKEKRSKKSKAKVLKDHNSNKNGQNELHSLAAAAAVANQTQYPVQTLAPQLTAAGNKSKNATENSPLLPLLEEEETEHSSTFPRHHRRHSVQHGQEKLYASTYLHRHSYDYVSIAVAFLKDFEAARPPTLPPNVAVITPWQMGLYRIKYSSWYSTMLGSATIALFLSSALEGPSQTDSNSRMQALTTLNLYALVVFATDMWIRAQFQRYEQPRHNKNIYQQQQQPGGRNKAISPSKTFTSLPVMVNTRTSQANLLTRPLCLFGLFLGLENMGWLVAKPDRTFVVLYSSIWKPIVLYYISSQARHAMEALMRIARTVIRVLVIEMVLILSFAAVACRLFQDFDPFDHLSVAWLSLFKLATTVVNPSIWMPMYQSTHWSAVFFILFIVVTVFYMHSLVLSVVFQTYIQAAGEIHDRSATDREDSLQLAFESLKKQHQEDSPKQQAHHNQHTKNGDKKPTHHHHSSSASWNGSGVPMYLIREALETIRPHYNVMKINALVEMFGNNNASDVDFPTFRTKIRQALNASIRSARIASPLAMSIELTAVVVAVVNFIYVILLTSSFSTWWFDAIELQLGAVITVAGLVELIMRTNPFRVHNFTPMTRFNAAFDGLAMLAALISSVGIGMAIFGSQSSPLQYILMGRAVDMIRVMRFFQIFRDVVRRSSDVLPAMLGPITLVLTMLHIFVYIGMALWGGAIEVGELTEYEITPLYDLNNFNSYLEGLVTMFQVLVVNDWHAIAEVFLYANRCSSPQIVYPFFVVGNLVGVNILLNVITAFFVESFVTKLAGGDGSMERPESVASSAGKDFAIKTPENTGVRRVSSSIGMSRMTGNEADEDDDDSNAHDADSEGSSDDSELFEFDVYERAGYDSIIQTVAGGQQGDDYARQVCNQFELFESLAPGREKVGYLVCCQQTMNRYGNRRFETEAADYIGKMELHSLVSDMHAELLALLRSSNASFNDRSLIRAVQHPKDESRELEISATILRRSPALSLFVSRVVPTSSDLQES